MITSPTNPTQAGHARKIAPTSFLLRIRSIPSAPSAIPLRPVRRFPLGAKAHPWPTFSQLLGQTPRTAVLASTRYTTVPHLPPSESADRPRCYPNCHFGFDRRAHLWYPFRDWV